jgi:hypothetical protein
VAQTVFKRLQGSSATPTLPCASPVIAAFVGSKAFNVPGDCAFLGQIGKQHTSTVLHNLHSTSISATSIHFTANTASQSIRRHLHRFANHRAPLVVGNRALGPATLAEPITWDLVATAFSQNRSCSQKCAQPHAHQPIVRAEWPAERAEMRFGGAPPTWAFWPPILRGAVSNVSPGMGSTCTAYK